MKYNKALGLRPQMTHILVGFTPYHLLPMTEIANGLSGRVCVFHPSIRAGLPSAFGTNVEILGRSDRKMLRYMSAAQRIRQIVKGAEELSVYAPHPYNPITNYLLLSVNQAQRFVYEDGLLNYYDASTPPLVGTRLWSRRLRAAVLGLPYKPFSGHLSGIDAFHPVAGYFGSPEAISRPSAFGELRKLERAWREAGATPGTRSKAGVTLFLDQPIEKVLSRSHAILVREAAETFAETLGCPVQYKPHHDQGRYNSRRAGWHSVPPSERSVPAEVYVKKSDVVNVVGFFSSALSNIAGQGGSRHCYAVGADAVTVPVNGHPSTLAEILNLFGVECISVHAVSSAGARDD